MRRLNPLPLRLATPLAVLALWLSAPAPAADDPARRGFDPDPPRPAVTLDGDLSVETAEPSPAGSWRAAVLLDYSRGLLAIRQADLKLGDLLVDRLQAHLLAGYSLGRLQLGFDVPFALRQTSNLSLLTDAGISGPVVAPIARSAMGDVRGVARLSLLDEASFKLLSLAVALEARAPTGNGQAFYGDGPLAIPSVLASRRLGPVRLDLNLGYVVRGQGQYLQLVAHDAFAYGLGAAMALPKAGPLDDWKALLEVDGQLPRGLRQTSDRYQAPLEARAGIRVRLWRSLSVELGGGAGLAAQSGYGRERFRVFGEVRWDQDLPDRDGDGVPDAQDRCPDTPGLARLGGCTEGDSDGDGVPDTVDKCPEAPGPREFDGCPDTDGDDIPDNEDRCPTAPGPAQNDGCPLPPETPLVTLLPDRLVLKAGVHFDTGKDTIKKVSLRVLDEVATLLLAHPEAKLVQVEGHTDNAGSATLNKDLSQRRAQAVVNHLVSHGVSRERLIPRGFGSERPIATNATVLGRAKNRRVDFTLLREPPASGAR